eukprot:TRINITY_DN457_c0_g2_i1.p1 TRINITY_DN457_c0_g2~~TRINITY_DN457_c0_g2_i1.p1  ORF type:complete len:514 (+),score=146.62 TRINITY_DN457_c0_g2_i1:99-1640(+)
MAWEHVRKFGSPDYHPSCRRAHTASAVGDTIVVFGGRGGTAAAAQKHSSDVILLDTTTMSWSCPTQSDGSPLENTPSLRWNHTAVVIGRSILIFGGENDTKLHEDLCRFELDLLTWTDIEASSLSGKTPCARYAHSACAWRRKMVIFGGSSQAHLNDTWAYDSDSNAWMEFETAGDRPSPRCGHASAILGDRLWVFGGLSQNFRNDLYYLDLQKHFWQQVTTFSGRPPSIRGHLTATRVGGSIVFFGGWNGGREGCNVPQLMNDVHALSIDEEAQCSWRQPWLQGTPPCPRNTHTASLVGDRVYIFGGWDRKTCFHDLFALNVAPLLEHEQLVRFGAALRNRLFNRRDFCDVTFSVGGKTLDAHKCILAARSEFFATLFASGMKESQSSVIEVDSICPDSSPASFEAFSAFIAYLYGGTVPSAPHECLELLQLADFYRDDMLRDLCDSRARSHVDVSNVAELLMLAEKLQERELLDFYLSFVVGNYKEVQPTLRDVSGPIKDRIMERLVHKIR